MEVDIRVRLDKENNRWQAEANGLDGWGVGHTVLDAVCDLLVNLRNYYEKLRVKDKRMDEVLTKYERSQFYRLYTFGFGDSNNKFYRIVSDW